MKKRTGLSPRLRFEVFKRDGFRCVYCGATPVESPLHIDHVKAVADGGGDDPTNLVTACQACNGGKSNVPLEQRRLGPKRTPEEAADHADQILAYLAAEKAVVEAKRAVSDSIAEEWGRATGFEPTVQERSFLSAAVDRYGMANVVEAIGVAVARVGISSRNSNHNFRYLCGIVRRWRETGDTTVAGVRRHFDGSQSA